MAQTTIMQHHSPVAARLSSTAPATFDGELTILSISEGNWVLRLPPSLIQHQPELERLLTKVFSGRTEENLALAQQMSLNWCVAKCKQSGLTLDECLSGP